MKARLKNIAKALKLTSRAINIIYESPLVIKNYGSKRF